MIIVDLTSVWWLPGAVSGVLLNPVHILMFTASVHSWRFWDLNTGCEHGRLSKLPVFMAHVGVYFGHPCSRLTFLTPTNTGRVVCTGL